MNAPLFNLSVKRVGGLTWFRLGRLTLALCIGREYRPLGSAPRPAKAQRYTAYQMERAYQMGRRAAMLQQRAV